MKPTIGIIAPMTDLEQYHLDFTIRLPQGQELTLAALNELAGSGFQTELLPSISYGQDSIPAAGYYLSSLLRRAGYNTYLSGKFDLDSLRVMAKQNPHVVCLSTTMILKSGSLRKVVNNIREAMPGVFIIIGGVYVWKSFHFNKILPEVSKSDFTETLLFQDGTEDINGDVFIVSSHGRTPLLKVLDEFMKGKAADYTKIPNLAFPGNSGYSFTERRDETVDHDTDTTFWEYLDEIPGQIPFRTSIGCPFRCRFCDFYHIYPNIHLRSKESLLEELKIIRSKLGDRPAILHATDDNIFMNRKRLLEVTETIIQSGIPRWIGFLRAESINESNIEAIKRSGLMMAIIGVESGDEGQLKRMNKKQKLGDVKKGIELLDQHGITVMMTYIVGYPGETGQTIENTARFMNEMKIGHASSSYQLFPLYISPFSDLMKEEFRREWNLKGVYDNWSHSTMDYPGSISAGYELFRKTIHVPYHYSQERTWYNREKFSYELRRDLFGLRRDLTISIIEGHDNGRKLRTINSMLCKMGKANVQVPVDFPGKLHVGFKKPKA